MTLATCRKCSASIDTSAKFCTTCGTPNSVQRTINPVHSQQSAKPAQSMRSAYTIMGLAAAGIVVLAIVATTMQSSSKNSHTRATDTESGTQVTSDDSNQQEIDSVSDTVIAFQQSMDRQDALDKKYNSARQAAAEANDYDAVAKAANIFAAEQQAEIDEISTIEIPRLDNRKAATHLQDAYAALKQYADLQLQFAQSIIKAHDHTEQINLKVRLKEIENLTSSAQVRYLLSLQVTYLAYGFKIEDIDDKTLRPFPGRQPHRK